MAWKALPACCQNCGRVNIPLTTDEEQLESTNAIRSISLIFTFITGSTSSLYGERAVLVSRSWPRFPHTSMQHILGAGTDNSVSPGALFVICPRVAGSLWQSEWDLHTWAHKRTRKNPASPGRRSNMLIDLYLFGHDSSSPGKNLF